MSDAAVWSTATWAIAPRRRGRSSQSEGPLADRVEIAGGNWLTVDAVHIIKSLRLPAITQIVHVGAALGATTPREVRVEAMREQEFAAAFNAASELASEMVAADEIDGPDPDIWNSAWTSLSPFAAKLAAPLVNPLQLGGVSCEWHERGMNIELRFRGRDDVYTVVEDATGEAPEFFGRDAGLRRAVNALRILVARQV